MLFDTHTHIRPYSYDGKQSLDELLAAAEAAGLAGVCLTDHYEKDVTYEGVAQTDFAPDEYFARLSPLRRPEPTERPAFLLGIELGYLPHLDDHFADLIARYPFDGVILSLHILVGEDPFVDKSMFVRGPLRVYSRYLEQLSEMIDRCPDFDILGHFDYISRYAPGPDKKMCYHNHAAEFDALFGLMIRSNKTLEINTQTVAVLQRAGYAGLDAWPDAAILRRYRALGGTTVSLGSDAHQAARVGSLLAEGAAWLSGLGFTGLTHHVNRRPVLTPLAPASDRSSPQP